MALLGASLAFGQGDLLSEFTALPERSLVTENRSRPAASHAPAPARITDDGQQGEGYTATAQLIFAFESGHPRSISVEVFDERGRKVRSSILTSRPGRNALAMDVADLHAGGYVARVSEGNGARVVRFHR